jgi:hypothetical protein
MATRVYEGIVLSGHVACGLWRAINLGNACVLQAMAAVYFCVHTFKTRTTLYILHIYEIHKYTCVIELKISRCLALTWCRGMYAKRNILDDETTNGLNIEVATTTHHYTCIDHCPWRHTRYLDPHMNSLQATYSLGRSIRNKVTSSYEYTPLEY